MKQRMLFVDDRTNRIHYALNHYPEYDVVIATCVPEAMRQLTGSDWDVVSLDLDLDGRDFENLDLGNTSIAIARYIEETGWPPQRTKPKFIIHSTNIFGANLLRKILSRIGLEVECRPLGWKKYQRGVVAGAFDVIHPGYIALLADAKEQCHHLTVLVHNKPGQVFSLDDRICVLGGIRYVDRVCVYNTEEELNSLFDALKPDVRIVGSDHEGQTTRPTLPFPTYYHKRTSDWSATKYKKMVRGAL